MNEDRRREIGLFRYTLIRDAADEGCRKLSVAGSFAHSPVVSMSGPMGSWSASRAARWMNGFVLTVVAGLTPCFPG